MASYASDVAFGLHNQQTVRQLLNEKYGGDHIEQGRYATFDYISHDGLRLVEVKSLRCRSDQHPHALMGANKVDAARRAHPNKTVIFVWVYQDDVFYAQYDPAVWDGFDRISCMRSARTGIVDRSADTVWVPKEYLIPLRSREDPSSTNTPFPVTALQPAPLVASS